MKYTNALLTNPKDSFEGSEEGLISEEAEELDLGFKRLQLNNIFSLSMPINKDYTAAMQSRRKLLKRGKGFYETNLKNIFIDYLFRSISTE